MGKINLKHLMLMLIENGFNTKKLKGITFENDLLSSVSCNKLLCLIKTN